MTRREAWLSLLFVGATALVTRIWAASLITFPRPEDTAYYVGVARNLVTGRGLVSDAIWNFGTPPLEFPRPAFEVWLPLPSLLAAIPMSLFGTTFASAQWSSVLVGTLVAVLAWRLGADVAAERDLPPGRARAIGLGTGLTTAVFLPLVFHSALPDSTIPFAALVLVACLLAGRIARDPGGMRLADRRVLALGLTLGLAALTRNEAVWLAVGWAMVAWGISAGSRAAWVRLVAAAAVPAMIVFAPWAVRDWIVFGNPLPGQALTNALSLKGTDIFAWGDPPTLDRYLAAGLPTLLALRWEGFVHNLVSVLLVTGLPITAIGMLALPGTWRASALRLLVVFSILAFATTTLLFPVATTWGTFLHASAAVLVLLVVAALVGLDRLIAAIGARRGWTRPVAWLGPFMTVAAGALFTVALIPSFGRGGDMVRDQYAALPAALAAAGAPIGPDLGPVIARSPIWLAEETGIRTLALPDESPASVLDLARTFPGTTVVISGTNPGERWPGIARTDPVGTGCFEPVALVDPSGRGLFDDLRAFRITCP
ncbi:MAG: hypothetical protein EPO00_05705 [Chloroflexota bacterium]|nr:MAG: hypothetical protein EPO00_05705 [Chloroflexota bacterium]